MYESIFDMLENLKSSRDCLKFAHIFEAKTIDKNEFLDVKEKLPQYSEISIKFTIDRENRKDLVQYDIKK